MDAVDTSSPQSSSSGDGSQRLAAIRMPIEEPVEDFDEAVQKLKQCSSTELHRARKRHRRALDSLGNGGYSSLSDATRERLHGQLRRNLDLLNQALESDRSGSVENDDSESRSTNTALLARLRNVFQNMWST